MILQRAQILAWIAWDASGFFEWLARRPWYGEILTDWAAAIPVVSGDRALEVGCGPGVLSAAMQKLGVVMTGLERSPAMVKRARRNVPECTFIEGDALSIPLPNAELDVAFAASVVNVVSDPQKLVSEMARVVRPGGRVSVLFPTPELSRNYKGIAKQRKIRGLSAAALATWGSKAPKREPETIEPLFTEAGLQEIGVCRYFDNSIASVTGLVS